MKSSCEIASTITRFVSSGRLRSKLRKPGFDVADGHAGCLGGERGGQRRIDVPRDEHQVRLRLGDHRLEPLDDAGDLLRVRPGACAEEVVRLPERELVDEHLRHLVVVVLARMDEHVLEIVRPAAQLAYDRRRLHEVRPRADDRQDPGPDRHERRMIESRFRLTSAWSGVFSRLAPHTPEREFPCLFGANDCAESRMMRAARGFPRRSPRRQRRA